MCADESGRSVLLFGNPLFTGPKDRHSAEAGEWTRATHLNVKCSHPLPFRWAGPNEVFGVGENQDSDGAGAPLFAHQGAGDGSGTVALSRNRMPPPAFPSDWGGAPSQ